VFSIILVIGLDGARGCHGIQRRWGWYQGVRNIIIMSFYLISEKINRCKKFIRITGRLFYFLKCKFIMYE